MFHLAQGSLVGVAGKRCVVLLLALLGGCSAGSGVRPGGSGGVGDGGGTGGTGVGDGGGTGGTGGARIQATFQATVNRNMDILFMIDNSPSMLPLQAKFLAQFPTFMNVLKLLPSGDGTGTGLPDLHVAVVSSDTGPGKFDLPADHCAFAGDGGRFQTQPRGTCTTAPLPPGQTFLSTSINQTLKNYTGDITDAFTCIAALGDQGCGFEGPLKAVRWALDPSNALAADTNNGFLRPDAFLAVILLTNEDDCSVPDASDLIDPSPAGVAAFGPFKSFRCNEFGHLCRKDGTLQSPQRGPAVGNLQDCVSNDTATGKLTKVADEVSFLKGLKSDPGRIFVAAITGPTTPYSLGPDADGDQSVVHSCALGTGEYADPAVRIQQWVEGFGNHGLLQTICAFSFAPPLMVIATELGKLTGPTCIPDNLVDTDLAAPGIQPECQVADLYVNDQGTTVSTPLQACAANNNTPPCWSLFPDANRCPGSSLIFAATRAPGTALPNGLRTTLSCAECVPGSTVPGCP